MQMTAIHRRSSFHRSYFSLSPASLSAPSSFDGVILHWRTPKVMTPLVQDPTGFVSKSIKLGVDAQLLDEATRKYMGYILGEDGQVVYVSVPFGAPGGYRKVCTGLVINVVYLCKKNKSINSSVLFVAEFGGK